MKSHPVGFQNQILGSSSRLRDFGAAEKLTTCWSLVVADMILLQCLLSATVRWPESAGVPAIREMG